MDYFGIILTTIITSVVTIIITNIITKTCITRMYNWFYCTESITKYQEIIDLFDKELKNIDQNYNNIKNSEMYQMLIDIKAIIEKLNFKVARSDQIESLRNEMALKNDMDTKFDNLNNKFDNLNNKFDNLLNELKKINERLDSFDSPLGIRVDLGVTNPRRRR